MNTATTHRSLALCAFLCTLSFNAVAGPIVLKPEDKCGVGIFCKWLTDTKSQGEFLLFHPGRVTSLDHGAKTLVSPNEFWRVSLGAGAKLFEEMQQGADFFADGITPAVDPPINGSSSSPDDAVFVSGSFQHTVKAHDDFDQNKNGDPFNFNLAVFSSPLGIGSNDQASGSTQHFPHLDFFDTSLFGLPDPIDPGLFNGWGLVLKAEHPPSSGIFFYPADIVFVPEPTTLALMTLGIAGVSYSRREVACANHRPG